MGSVAPPAVASAAPQTAEVVMLDSAQVQAILHPSPAPVVPRLREASETRPIRDLARLSDPAPKAESVAVPLVDLAQAAPATLTPPQPQPTEAVERLTPPLAGAVGSRPEPESTDSPKQPAESNAQPDSEPRAESQTLAPLGANVVIVHRPPLVYPASARRAGIEGKTRVGLEIGNDGSVQRAWILQSSGSTLLDKSAVENVRRWRFDRKSVAAGGVFQQTICFQLHPGG